MTAGALAALLGQDGEAGSPAPGSSLALDGAPGCVSMSSNHAGQATGVGVSAVPGVAADLCDGPQVPTSS